MKILAFDSSGLVASVAVLEEERMIAEYTVNYKKTHSQTLLPMLDEVVKMTELDLNEIDAIAVAAGPALAAHHLRLDGHLLAQSKAGNPLAQSGNLPRDLMPLGDGVFGERVLPVIHMDIRAAHANLLDFHQHLAGLGLRGGHFPKCNHTRRCHHLLQHGTFLLKGRFLRHQYSIAMKKMEDSFAAL